MFPVHAPSANGDLDFGQKLDQPARQQQHCSHEYERNSGAEIEPEQLTDKEQHNDEADRECARNAERRRPVAVFDAPLKHDKLGGIVMVRHPFGLFEERFENPCPVNRPVQAHANDVQYPANAGEQKDRGDRRLDRRNDGAIFGHDGFSPHGKAKAAHVSDDPRGLVMQRSGSWLFRRFALLAILVAVEQR